MPRHSVPCSRCGNPRPVNRKSRIEVTCQPCRRELRAQRGDPDEVRRQDAREAKRRSRARQGHGQTRREWNCTVCDVLVEGTGRGPGGTYCKKHRWHDRGHRKRARKYGVHYEYINPRTIYIRDNWRCGLCRRRVDSALTYPHPMSASLDHLVPMSRGGDHSPVNVQCSHLKCNLDKGYAGGGEQLALVG